MTTGKTISGAVVRQRSAKKAKAKKSASNSIKPRAIEDEQNENNAVKAILYCRVSSRQQEAEGHGLVSQETRCREYAMSRGYEVVAVFPDTISGGGDFMKRPGMVALLSFVDAQPDESFVVIFDDLKRFARDTRFHLDLRDAFHRRGVRIECLNYRIGNTAEDKFLETIMAAQGELERLQNGRQVAQKMKARMQAGFWIHKAPIGYRFETIKGRGKVLMPHEPFASIVREAIEGFASGRFQTQSEIKRFLETFPEFPRNAQGEVAWQRIADITTQPVYTGHICSETYGLNWLKGQHEPLISLDTFDKVQARRNGTAYAPARKNIGDDFACRGVVVCADCTKPLRSSWPKGKTKSYPYYLCQTPNCSQYGKSIPRDKLEGDIGDLIRSLQPTPGLLSVARAMFAAAWEQRRTQAVEVTRSGQRRIVEVDKQIETLLSRILEASNATVIRSYEAKVAELDRQKLVLAEQMTKQVEAPGKFSQSLELALGFLSNPWKIWETGQVSMRRTVLKLAFTDRIKYTRNEGPRTPEIALPFRALAGFSGGVLVNGAVRED